MLKPKKKASFETVWKYLKLFDKTIGFFLFKDATEKWTLAEKFFQLTVPRHVSFFCFGAISTLIVTDFELMSIILASSLGSSMVALYISLMVFTSRKDVIMDLLDRCKSMYDVKKKYHERIQKLAEAQLVSIETRATKVLKWLSIIFYVDAFGFTLGFAIIGTFLPDSIYPKLSPPVPFYLPFKEQVSWEAFITNVLFQTTVAIDTSTLTIYVYGIAICLFIHILGYLDIIQEAAEQMKQEMLSSMKEFEVQQESTVKSTLQLETLAIVNANSAEDQNPSISFDQWAQILNEMISDVNSLISSSTKLFALPFLFNEIASLGSLFICGLIFTVLRQQYFFAVGITIVCGLVFIDCYVNEQILEKMENINATLYDMPWYGFDPKQRKTLMILMHCDKIQRGFTAGGIHSLTLERFGIIVKAGYTNLLVLKDLVQK